MKLTRDEFFKRVNDYVGDDRSDEAIAFIEDMTDTYEELSGSIDNSGIDWEKKFYDNDKAWREKYRHRFFSGGSIRTSVEDEIEDENKDTDITIDELFKED